MVDEDLKQAVEDELEIQLKTLGAVLEIFVETHLGVFKSVAQAHKVLFDCFVEQGFTEEQALKLVCSGNLVNQIGQSVK